MRWPRRCAAERRARLHRAPAGARHRIRRRADWRMIARCSNSAPKRLSSRTTCWSKGSISCPMPIWPMSPGSWSPPIYPTSPPRAQSRSGCCWASCSARMSDALRRWGWKRCSTIMACPLLGGDTSSGGPPRSFGLTAIGRATHVPVPSRSGAQAGDALYITGEIGAAMMGFDALRDGTDADSTALSPADGPACARPGAGPAGQRDDGYFRRAAARCRAHGACQRRDHGDQERFGAFGCPRRC